MARLGKMIEKQIQSHYLQEEKAVNIYLPETFDLTFETTLCFMQDGNDYFQMGRIATLSDKLHKNESLHNTVFIGIHYADRKDRLKKYHPNGEQYEQYQRFLIEEVLPVVEAAIPLNPLGVIRGLMGDSLAGTFAIATALAYPDIFRKVVMQSPLIDEAVYSIIQTAQTDPLSIYHSVGLQETAVPTSLGKEVDFVTSNKKAADYLKQTYRDYVYREIKAGNHTWKHWQKELPEVLEDMLG